MAKARSTSGLPQVNAGLLYGEMDVSLLPTPGGMVQGSLDLVVPVYNAATSQWYLAKLVGGGGMDIAYNAIDNTLEIHFNDNRVYASFSADAILYGTVTASATASAELVV